MLKSVLYFSICVLAFTTGTVSATASMSQERTLSILKPDAVGSNQIGNIVARYENAGLRVMGMKMLHLSRQQAEGFYAAHAERPFYADLVSYMTSGPVLVLVLEGPDAVQANRELMGATDPSKALPGSIRALYGTSIQENAVHGSDSVENALTEIAFFFHGNEVLIRTR